MIMNIQEIIKRIKEFSNIRDDAGDDEPALLEVALFIENEFGFVLTDDEICQDNLGTYQNLERFVTEKLEVLNPAP
jgi:acyl carrier protein